MAQVVIVDSTVDRRESWAEALRRAGHEVIEFVGSPTEGSLATAWGANAVVFVHAGDAQDLPQGMWHAMLENGRIVVAFSGGGLYEGEAERVEDDRGRALELQAGMVWVRNALGRSDAARVVAAVALVGDGVDRDRFVAALEGERWPENLVALYLVCRAITELDDDQRRRPLLATDWGDMIERAKEEACSEGFGDLVLDGLTVESAERASERIGEWLRRAEL